MTVETILNLVWASSAVTALAVFVLCEWRSRRGARLTTRCRRGLAIFVAAVALFPSVSVSDDFVRIGSLQVGIPTSQQISGQADANSSEMPGIYLARLSDALESSQISSVCGLLVTLHFFALVGVQFEHGRDRSLPSFASRAPPPSLPLA